MSPKEKAEELIEKMYIEQNMYRSDCIACALICVEEIILSHAIWSTEQDEYLDYYNEVKQELENNK